MYNLVDLHHSQQIAIESDCAVVFIINNNVKYFNFLIQAVNNITYLHDVDIYILCLDCKSQIQQLFQSYQNNTKLHILDIEFSQDLMDIKEKFISRQYEFQYIKPIAFHNFIKNQLNKNIQKILYLDVDTFPVRNIQNLFQDITKKLVVIQELGIDYNTFGYRQYVNSLSIYNYFKISQPNMWGRREPPVNTGVIGLDVNRDKEIINTWEQVTIKILRENLRPLVKWWDQGCFMLALELLGKKDIVSNNRDYNHTILYKDCHLTVLQETEANILHFIGDQKINILKMVNNKQDVNAEFLEVAIAGHNSEQFFCIHPRSYLQYKILSELNYDKEIYKDNSLGESRIFLANSLFKESSEVVGTVSASWNKKYHPNKIDHMLNWPQFPVIEKIQKDPSLVVCATICAGAYSKKHDPVWTKNFQTHFRNEFKQSEWVEQKLFDITGLRYDGIRPAPYSNQIICHKTVFYELCDFMKRHIDDIIETFSLKPNYQTPDPNRPLAYILEELSMLWWASKPGVQLIPVVDIQPNWYKKQ